MTRRLTGRERAARQEALKAIARAQVRAGLEAAPGETPRQVPILPAPREPPPEPDGLADPAAWRRRCRQIRTELEDNAAALGWCRATRRPDCKCFRCHRPA